MNRLIIVILIGLVQIPANAQQVSFLTGLSAESLTDLKQFQSAFINAAIVPLKSTQAFPPYLQYSLNVSFPKKSALKFNFNLFTTSTAARSVYQDYSGKVQVDQKLKCFGIGPGLVGLIEDTLKLRVEYFVNAGLEFSTLNADVYTAVGADEENSTEKFSATSAYGEIGLGLTYTFNGHWSAIARLGAHISQAAQLKNKTDEFPKVNWTGGKFLAGIGYSF